MTVASLLRYQLQEFFFSDLDTGNHRAKATVARAANRMTKKSAGFTKDPLSCTRQATALYMPAT